MGKIGRNQSCPCGSGKKYKHCCLLKRQVEPAANPEQRMKASLKAGIEKIQRSAAEKKVAFFELGVFLFFSDEDGNAWMLETTEADALQVARNGQPLQAPVDENTETIAINFSHTYVIRDRELFLTAYEDKSESRLDKAPCMQINAAMRRLRKHYSKEMLDQLHLDSEEPLPGQ